MEIIPFNYQVLGYSKIYPAGKFNSPFQKYRKGFIYPPRRSVPGNLPFGRKTLWTLKPQFRYSQLGKPQGGFKRAFESPNPGNFTSLGGA